MNYKSHLLDRFQTYTFSTHPKLRTRYEKTMAPEYQTHHAIKVRRHLSYEGFHYLIRLRNSCCTVKYFCITYPNLPFGVTPGTYKCPWGTVTWQPNLRHDVVNIEINLDSSSGLSLFRSADPEKPKTIVIRNADRSFEIEYQDGIEGASLHVGQRNIVIGNYSKLTGKPVKYEDLEVDSRVGSPPGPKSLWIRADPFSPDHETY